MNDQLALVGPATPPNLHLTARQRFALEFVHQKPASSEQLGAALHEYRMKKGGRGHDADGRCDFCKPEGAGMGARLRELGLVRFSRKLGVWYLNEDGKPTSVGASSQTDDIPY